MKRRHQDENGLDTDVEDDDGDFPEAGNDDIVDFGWQDDAADKPLSGRRKKAAQAAKKKAKPGSFGTLFVCLVGITHLAFHSLPSPH